MQSIFELKLGGNGHGCSIETKCRRWRYDWRWSIWSFCETERCI